MSADSMVRGLLVSQVGYDSAMVKRAIVRGPEGELSEAARFVLRGAAGDAVEGVVNAWGSLWGSRWWIADFSSVAHAGTFCIEIHDRGEMRFSAEIEIGPGLLWERTWEHVSINQAERRQRLASQHEGRHLGWYDAGAHWQEANSHAAYLLGLCDLATHAAGRIDDRCRPRLETQLLNGADYLAHLQDMAVAKGFGDGPLVHQSFKLENLVLPSDAAKAAAAWARVAAVLKNHTAASGYRQRALRAMDWLLAAPRYGGLHFCGVPHGVPDDFPRPDEISTPDLAHLVQAALDLGDPRFVPLMDRWLARQVPEEAAQDGLHGHFRLFDSSPLTEKTWTHGFDPQGHGYNLGQTCGHNLLPLILAQQTHPDHPDAKRWRAAIESYAYGYFIPACRMSPFLIAPLGHYPGEGILHFAGLWHGMNAVYGNAAALALEFSKLFGDAAFAEIAAGNLQWIAGLNAGLTSASLSASHMFSTDVPPEVALPVSMICGVGRRTAGPWLNIRGSICNGFSTGDQFVYDVSATHANDGPRTFTDEDWITHAGGWLSAIARC